MQYNWLKLSERYVVGLDEVGRGCLAGDVYAAAVLFDLESPELKSQLLKLKNVTDSKKLNAKKRYELSQIIRAHCKHAIAYSTVKEIEDHNILNASLLAMKRAFFALNPAAPLEAYHLLVDGNKKVKGLEAYKQTCLIKGDLRALPIGAASIIAKVERDQMLVRLSQDHPQYGFEIHKGYATAIHKKAIERHGPSPVHRKTFAGVKEWTSFTRANR